MENNSNSGKQSLFSKNWMLFVSMFATAIIYFLTLAIFTPSFELSDDVGMRNLASGYYNGDHSPYLVFINILLGQVITALYKIAPGLPWYGIVFYLAHFISTISILHILLQANDNRKRLLYFTPVTCGLLMYILLRLQFSSLASHLALAGSLVLIRAFEVESAKKGILTILIGSFMILSGLLIRFNAALLITGISIVFMMIFEQKLLLSRRYIIFFIVLTCGFALGKYNTYQYQNDSNHSSFYELNKVRGELIDYKFLDDQYSIVANDLKLFNWSEDEFFLFKNNFFDTRTSFQSLATLRKLNTQIPRINFSLKSLSENLLKILTPLPSKVFSIFYLLLLITANGKTEKIKVILFGSVLLSIFVFLIFVFKAPPPRIYNPVLLAASVLLIYKIDFRLSTNRLYNLSVITVIVGLSLVSIWLDIKISRKNSKLHQDHEKSIQILNEIELDGKHLYFYGATILFPYHPLKPIAENETYNQVKVYGGGWISNIYESSSETSKYSPRNIYEDLLDDRNILLALPYEGFNERMQALMAIYRRQFNIEAIEHEIVSQFHGNQKGFKVVKIRAMNL